MCESGARCVVPEAGFPIIHSPFLWTPQDPRTYGYTLSLPISKTLLQVVMSLLSVVPSWLSAVKNPTLDTSTSHSVPDLCHCPGPGKTVPGSPGSGGHESRGPDPSSHIVKPALRFSWPKSSFVKMMTSDFKFSFI